MSLLFLRKKGARKTRSHYLYFFKCLQKTKEQVAKLKKENIFPVKSCRLIGRGLTPIARRPKIVEKEILFKYPEIKDFDCFYVHYEAGCSIAGLRLGKKLNIKTIQVMHGREDIGDQNLISFGFKTIVAPLLNLFHSWYLPHSVKVKKDDYLATTIAGNKMWTLMVNHANFADLVIAPSAHFQKKLKHYGVKKQIQVLPNGVSDELFIPDLKEIIPASSDYWSKTTHGMVSDVMAVRRSSAGTTSDSNSSSYYTLCYK